jgi:bifunctional NMN adenylyltransferase/nudix hydrolase
MKKTYEWAVVIGRFQPFHKGHAAMIEKAYEVADSVCVVLGSAKSARTTKNPFTAYERETMIDNFVFRSLKTWRELKVVPMRDYFYNDALWVTTLQQKVRRIVGKSRVALIGHHKDASSYYLDLFPGWDFVEHDPEANGCVGRLNATDIRTAWFENRSDFVSDAIPATTHEVLASLEERKIVDQLREEHIYLRNYGKAWGVGPFVTADAVVTKAGHVLLVKRGPGIGTGLHAVPGGFVNKGERILDAAIRELREETGLAIYSAADLKRVLVGTEVFDHPDRSLRARIITHAFHFDLDRLGEPGLPAVVGGDDAAQAFWMPLYEVFENPEQYFEDHEEIIRRFVMR